MRITLEKPIPVYESRRYKYVRVGDLPEEYRPQISRWIFGSLQPLIQGEEGAILDAIFLQDYEKYIRGDETPLTDDEVHAILGV